ncbi:phosphatase PAP2 family protein [Kocuria sp. M1R5S2]|uniref:phosphatase PAP2 family protein n=1 Tax=Kocuria rhizosphaerae TaxID=3376285 RepID=UPI0037B098B6
MTTTAHRPAPTVVQALVHVLGAAAMFGAAYLVGAVALTTTTGQWLDELAFQQAKGAFPDLSVRAQQLLDLVPWAVGTASALCLAVLAVRSRRLVPVVTGAAVVVLSNLTVQLLKRVLLEKPDLGVQETAVNSFPSGHTAAAAAAVAVVLLAAPARSRPVVALLGAGATTATGVATLLNGWHRPSDVVAALLVVAGWAALGGLVLRATGPVERPVPGGGLTAVAAVLGVGALLAGLLPLWAALQELGSGYAAAAGCAAILGVSLLVAAALSAMQNPRPHRPRP